MTAFRSVLITLTLLLGVAACNGQGSTPTGSEESRKPLPSVSESPSTEAAPSASDEDGGGNGGRGAPKHLRDAAFCTKVDRVQMGATFGSNNGAGVKLTGSTKPSASTPAWTCAFAVELAGTTGRMAMSLQPQGATTGSVSKAVKSFTDDHESQGDTSCSSKDADGWPVGGLTTCSSSKAAAAEFQGLFGKGSFECSATFSAPNELRVTEVVYAVCPALLRKVAGK